MNYFKDINSRKFFELAPGANAQTFWGEQILMNIVHIDPNSVVPNHTHPHEQAGMLLEEAYCLQRSFGRMRGLFFSVLTFFIFTRSFPDIISLSIKTLIKLISLSLLIFNIL